jgi:hypothetical protein
MIDFSEIENTNLDKDLYYKLVRELSERNYNIYKTIINPSGKNRKLRYGNHLDHIYPISEGYKNGVDPKIIAHPCNLQIIGWKQNIRKNSKISKTLEELIEEINNFNPKIKFKK